MILGIDLSSNNGDFAHIDPTPYSFVVVKVTEGHDYKNPTRFAEAQWAVDHSKDLAVYHWHKPWIDCASQLQNMKDALVGMPAWLWWALDEEDPSQPASDQEWGSSVAAMTALCKQEFAPKKGAHYLGQFFHSATLLPQALDNFWWDPDYGTNDGVEHPILNGRKPVIHQYTSVHGLDVNHVLDEAAYAVLAGKITPPAPTEEPMARLTFFTIPDHPLGPPAQATVYRSDGLEAKSCTPASLAAWQIIERVHGATAADVAVGHLPFAIAKDLTGVLLPPADH